MITEVSKMNNNNILNQLISDFQSEISSMLKKNILLRQNSKKLWSELG